MGPKNKSLGVWPSAVFSISSIGDIHHHRVMAIELAT